MTETIKSTESASQTLQEHSFKRDQTTWLGYLLVGYYSFVCASFGPLMPFLRAELHVNYTVGALHFTSYACGVLIAGLRGDLIMRLFGRAKAQWWGAVGIIVGMFIIFFSHDPLITIFGAFVIGLFGSTMGQVINTTMSDRFQKDRAVGITEANIFASVCSTSAPLVLSLFVRMGIGWRGSFSTALLFLVGIAVFFLKAKIPEGQPLSQKLTSKPLPLAYWAYWLVIMLNVACEWSIVFWSSEFLERFANLTKADASAALSAFFVAMLTARIIGSKLVRVVSIRKLLIGASTLSLLGFMIFWLGTNYIYNIAGLFIAGLGVANMYPLTLSTAIGVANGRTSTATARMSISTGFAMLSAPLILGMVADHTGLFYSFRIVAILLSLGVLMVLVANHLAEREKAHSLSLRPE
jgi:fucose permease